MKKIISFGFINLEYGISLLLYALLYAYELFFVKKCETYKKKKLLEPLLYYFGNIFCFIPMLIIQNNSKMTNINQKVEMKRRKVKIIEYIYQNPNRRLEKKDIVFIAIISLLLIINSGCKIIKNIIVEKEENQINNEYIFIDFLIIFLLSKFALKISYYKHQIIACIGIIIIGAIRWIYIFFFINILMHFLLLFY